MVSLTTFARTASARMSERVTAAVWGQTRRFFRMQSRLRSNEPTQIFVCAVTGSAVGALVAGLHWLVDFLHQVGFAVSGDHSLSTGIGVDPMRIMIVPAVGGLALGLGALIMRRFRSNEVVDPIEANALHGGRMSFRGSVIVALQTVWSSGVGGSVGLEAGYTQLASGLAASLGRGFHLRRADQRVMVGCGAAAAIAAGRRLLCIRTRDRRLYAGQPDAGRRRRGCRLFRHPWI